MTTFEYNALDPGGRSSTGTIDAATRQAAIAMLAARQLFVTQIAERNGGGASIAKPQANAGAQAAASAFSRRRVRGRPLAMLWRQLATALDAGLPLLTSLRVVREQTQQPALAELLDDLAKRVETGSALSEALGAHHQTFSPLHVAMVRAGETAGVLDTVMASLADFAERDLAIREKVRSASTYPIIVLTLALVSVVVILAFILPRILESVGEDTSILPLPTLILMGLSDALRSYWWLIAVALGVGGWGLRHWLNTPAGRLTWDTWKLKVPLLGPTLRQVAVARFARALGTLSRSGIQIVEALRVLRNTLGNELLGQTVDDVQKRVTQGQPVAEALADTRQFPALFVQVVSLGEKTGRLDELLLRAADSLEKDSSAMIARMMTVLPALLIVGLALVVAFILAAVLLPIVNMQSAIPGA